MRYRILLSILILVAVALTGCYQTDEGLVVHTADPNLSILFLIPAVEVGETLPVPPLPPPCENIKGNIARSGEKIFHVAGGANYDQVKIDEAAGEKFFCSEQEALDAGWRKAQR